MMKGLRLKAVLFGFLTLTNIFIASFLYSVGMSSEAFVSGITAALCSIVWFLDKKVSDNVS